MMKGREVMSPSHRRFLHARIALLGGALAGLAAVAAAGDRETSGWGGGGRWEFGEGACYHCRALAEGLTAGEGAPEQRYEAATGRDLRNYATDRLVDFQRMRLDIDIPDMNKPELTARQTLTFTAIAQPVAALTLDAEQMEIGEVGMAEDSPLARTTKVEHSYDGSRLGLRFDPPLAPGAEAKVVVNYVLHDPPDGLFWTPESPAWPGRPAQIHTQGQPATNRYWFPAHDFPNERMTTEIVATVPAGFLVSANGHEVEKAKTSGGRTTFHWLQDKPHVAYLVSMVVGKFDVEDVAPKGSKLPMPVYVPQGQKGLIAKNYGRTPEMIRTFERRFGEPYAWDRYAQLLVWNFGSGGMENTSATTMYDTALLDEKALQDTDLDGLISHELGHQWFGDLITCNTWAHIWLNEGWATYCTALWFEERDGYQNGYMNSMQRTMRGIARRDQLAADSTSTRPGMVSRVYEHPWEVFRRVSNPYPKGASILHMLRMNLGDDLFFKGVAEYVDRYKFKTAETDDFRKVFEEVSGVSLERFFEQWAFRPGTPKVSVKGRWDEKRKELTLTLRQNQRIDAENPAYVFDLPIEVYTAQESISAADATPVKFVMSVDGVQHERTIALESEPAMVLIDPDLHVLMDIEADMPQGWLASQLTAPRSIASRLDAARFLRSKSGRKTNEALRGVLMNRDEYYTVRAAAAESLGALSDGEGLAQAVESGIDDPRVRAPAIEGLGKVGGPRSVAVLAARASDANESYACRASALEELGRRGDESHLPILLAGLEARSQHDQVRIGAIRGLALHKKKEGLTAIIPYTKAGSLSRVRPEAIGAVADLAELDKVAAYDAIAPLLFDREARARTSAGQALVDIKDKRGLAEIDRFIETTRHAEDRERAEGWRAALASRLAGENAQQSAGAEIEKLRTELKRLESKVNEKQD